MDSFSYLFAAYTAIWVVLFAYVLRLQRREKSLWQEIELLRQKLDQESGGAPS
jgi:CcmD family protein